MTNHFANWKESDVALHNQRVSGRPLEAPQTSDNASERELHAQILEECQKRGWIALHGSMAHRAMRTVGEYDFVILRDGGRFLLVECKTKTGKLTKEQQAMYAWAKKLGHDPHVVRSFQEFLDIL